MKNKITFTLLSFFLITYSESQVTKLWTTLCSPYEDGWSVLEAVALDAQSNIYLTGYCADNINPSKLFLIKLNSSGNVSWIRISDNVNRVASSIAIDVLGNVLISAATGLPHSDIVTKKYSPEGILQWSKIFSLGQASGEYPVKLKLDVFGNIFIGGGTINDFSAIDYLTIKLNIYGQPLWYKIYNSAGNSYDYLNDMALDMNGNVIVTGLSINQNTNSDYNTIKYDMNGNEVFLSKYYGVHNQSDDNAQSVSVDMFGNSYISGHSGGNGQSYCTAVIKYNNNGLQQWAVRFPETQYTSLYSKTLFDRSLNFWLTEHGSMIKLSFYGNVLNNIFDPVIKDIAIDKDNNIYNVTEKFIDSNIILNVNKYNPGGNRIFQYTSQNDTDIGSSNIYLAIDTSCSIYVASYVNINYGKISVLKLSQIIGVKLVSNEVPISFSLHQNYPNPFNPTTKIKFDIPLLRGVDGGAGRGVLVRLIVYDLLGREVATLVNEQLKPGTYEVEFDGSAYASGVYCYSLITSDFTGTKKLILLK